MSRKEYANCIHARRHEISTGKSRTYSCRVCREHYCLNDKNPCPFYRSRYMYKMEWVQGAGNEDIQVPVPKGEVVGDRYAGNKKKKAAL